jgi:hypothetical protein
MRKKALKNALKLIPDAPLKSDNMTKSQRKYKKRVWKSLSTPEKNLLIKIGNKKIAEAQISKNILNVMDEPMKNMAKGIVGKPVDLESLKTVA